MRKMLVFIDGSCKDIQNKETAVGGWSYIVTDTNFNVIAEDFGKLREGEQNSVRAELEALYRALLKIKTFKGNCKFHIYTDYESMVDSLNGFAERRANREYWNAIEPICIKLAGRFRISHILGHQKRTGDKLIEFNHKADKLAKAGANSLTKPPVKIAI